MVFSRMPNAEKNLYKLETISFNDCSVTEVSTDINYILCHAIEYIVRAVVRAQCNALLRTPRQIMTTV